MENKISDPYHIQYEENRLWEKTKWLGVPIQKFGNDLLIMQELIFKIQPDYIIESGTNYGGSAYFFATVLEIIGHGCILTIDIDGSKFNMRKFKELVRHRMVQLIGSSTNKWIIDQVRKECTGLKNMVFLDSWHGEVHVRKEMEIYHKLVSIGSYLIVEDTHVSKEGNPVKWEHDDDGPEGAVKEFLKAHKNFEVDKECEKLGLTFNPGGFLKRMY